ncbi:MAG: phosphatase PAP2 family protein [Solirubrobacteraceae bacterium]
MDPSVYHALNNFAYEHAWVGDIAKFFAEDAIFILIGGFAVLWLLRTRRGWLLSERARLAVFAGGLATILGLLIVQVIGKLWDRQRPFVVLHHFHKLIAHPADASFPSDHVTGAAALGFSLLIFRRYRMAAVALTAMLLIGVARVMVGVHWPTDILGGIGVGGAAALLIAAPRRPLERLAGWCSALYERVLLGGVALGGRLLRPRASKTRAYGGD